MRCSVALLCVLGALACGRATPRPSLLESELHPGTHASPGELGELLARLPAGADRCEGARPGMVSAQRRELVRWMSHASHSGSLRLAWVSDTPVIAVAEVRQEQPATGRQASFALVRVSNSAQMRQYFESHPELRIRWSDDLTPCPGPECWHTRAERVDDRTIRIRRGPWSETDRGTEFRCVELARRYPEALEVGARSGADGLFSAGSSDSDLGLDRASALLRDGAGLRRVEQYRLPDEGMATEIALLLENMREDLGGLAAIAERSQVTEGDLLEVRTTVRWGDLELRAGDEVRYREALALEAAASRPLAVEEVAIADLDMVREQVALRQQQLQNASPEEHSHAVSELRTLLERAADAHPAQDGLVEELVELLLRETDSAAEAAAWASRVLARGPRDARAWRVRRRAALARVGEDALVEALLADDVVHSTRRAQDAAAMLAKLPHRASYETAEGAWLTAAALGRVSGGLSRARGVLPLGSLGETLLTLADGGATSRSVHVRVQGPAPDDSRVRFSDGVVEWTEGSGLVRAGAASTDAPDGAYHMLRRMGARLNGRVRVTLALVSIGGDLASPEARISVEGDVREGALHLRQASAVIEGRHRTRVRWSRVPELVAEPVHGYEQRIFPPPNLGVVFADAAEAEDFLDRIADEDSLACNRMVRREAGVRCNVSPQRDSTRRAWRRGMSPLVFR